MADVEKLLSDYIAEHRERGRADPRPYLERLEGADRSLLDALIGGYLTRARRPWSAAEYADSPSERAVRAITSKWDDWELAEEPKPWTELLPTLRERAEIKRSELVSRLARAIGHPGEAERVGAYYHQMESGKLPSEGVSDTVLAALGDLLGESAAKLRAAGSAIGAGADRAQVASRVAFARTAIRDPAYEGGKALDGLAEQAPAAAPAGGEKASAPAATAEAERDEVDRLFTGGP